MGGNIWKNSKRLEKFEYDELSSKVNNFFKEKEFESSTVRSYHNKEDFGDLDILVKKPDNETAWNNINFEFEEKFKPQYKQFNGNVRSYFIDNFQVDIIWTKPQSYESSKFFFSYNDMGLLLGKIAYYHRFKLGFEGISVKAVINNEEFLEKVIIKDPNEIMKYFGLDIAIYEKGFNTLEQMFEWVSNSKYFTKDAYNQDIWRSDQRRRDNKRKTLDIFYEWLGETQPEDKYTLARPQKHETFLRFDAEFKEFELQEKFLQQLGKQYLLKEASQKFNGRLVMYNFGVEGKEVGNIISKFESQIGVGVKKHLWILENNSIDYIEKQLKFPLCYDAWIISYAEPIEEAMLSISSYREDFDYEEFRKKEYNKYLETFKIEEPFNELL